MTPGPQCRCGFAFLPARRKPSPRFAYGYGRAEDLAGVAIVLIILISAIVAAYEAIDRLMIGRRIVTVCFTHRFGCRYEFASDRRIAGELLMKLGI